MIDNDRTIGETYHISQIDRLFKSNDLKGKKKKHDFNMNLNKIILLWNDNTLVACIKR